MRQWSLLEVVVKGGINIAAPHYRTVIFTGSLSSSCSSRNTSITAVTKNCLKDSKCEDQCTIR